MFHWSRLLIHPRGVEGAHNFLGNSANTDSICQEKGELGQAQVPTPTLETKKQKRSAENLFQLYQKLCHFFGLVAVEKKTPFLVQLEIVFAPSYFYRALVDS